jgi:hypothetical protein
MFLHNSRGQAQFTGCRISDGRMRFDDRLDQAGGVGLIDPME